MLPLARKSLALTLILTITLALALSASADINVQQHHRRDHRLIKKRQALPPLVQVGSGRGGSNLAAGDKVLPPLVGAEADPNTPATTSVSKPAASTTSAAGGAPSTSRGGANNATPTSSTSTSTSRSSSTSASSTPSSSSESSTSSTAAPSTTEESLNLTDSPSNAAPSAAPRVTVTKVSSSTAAPTSSSAANTGASSTTKRTTLTIVIVIAASIGGAAVIWTVIRKWKFKPSSQFEDRMQPIDWQPTGAGTDDGGIPGHRRHNSGASSFHSGTSHGDAAPHVGYGATSDYHGGYGAGANANQPSLPPLPDHDFTAGATRTGLAPVGGYADLNRGPSPQPQMQDLSQGPMYRPQYEQYAGGVPLHHQTGYGVQDAYDYNGTAARY